MAVKYRSPSEQQWLIKGGWPFGALNKLQKIDYHWANFGQAITLKGISGSQG